MWQAQNVTPLPPPPPLRTPRASDCEIAYNTCSGRLPINQSLLQGHLWSYSVEALNKDILLNPETGLNFVIVTNPVTLERFVVLNNPSCDVSMFLNHFTQEFLSGDENADQLRLDQETVSALLKSMDTEYDRSILRAIIALLHTQTVNLGIDPALARIEDAECLLLLARI